MYCAMCHSNIWLYHVKILAISHTIQKETDFIDDDDDSLDKYELREHQL